MADDGHANGQGGGAQTGAADDELAEAQERIARAVRKLRAGGGSGGGSGGSGCSARASGIQPSRGGGEGDGSALSGRDLMAGLLTVRGRRGRGKRKRRAAERPSETQLMQTIGQYIQNAYAESSKGPIRSALNLFCDFEQEYSDRQMLLEPTRAGDPEAALHNEMSLMMFAAWMTHNGYAMSTVGTYLSLVKTNLGVSFGWALTCKEMEMRLPRMLKGMRRTHKRLRKKRLGWRALYERKLHAARGLPGGRDGKGEAAVRCTLRQGLLRGADCLPNTAATFDPERHSTTADLEHYDLPEPHYKLTVLPAKKSEQQAKTEIVLLPKGDGITDAYSALKRMLGDTRIGAAGSTAPLFTHADGLAWTIGEARAMFKRCGKVIGIKESELGAQSGRIGGATDMFAQGATPAMLQMSGRWDSVRRSSNPSPHTHTG